MFVVIIGNNNKAPYPRRVTPGRGLHAVIVPIITNLFFTFHYFKKLRDSGLSNFVQNQVSSINDVTPTYSFTGDIGNFSTQ